MQTFQSYHKICQDGVIERPRLPEWSEQCDHQANRARVVMTVAMTTDMHAAWLCSVRCHGMTSFPVAVAFVSLAFVYASPVES